MTERKGIIRVFAAMGVGAAILATAVLSGCGSGGPGGAGPGGPRGPDGSGDAANAVAVSTLRVSLGSLSRTLKTGGEVVAEDSVRVYPDIGGKVTSLPLAEGARIRKGELVARIDPSKPGEQYVESPVLAPISGTVTAVSVRVGETVSTATALATIGRTEALEIAARIPERFIGQLRTGSAATLSFAAWPEEVFPARIVQLDPVLDPDTRSLKATLSPQQANGRIKAGMYATVSLTLERRDDVIVVPASCLVSRGGADRQVFVVEDGRAGLRTVTPGLAAGGQVEIADGLSVGEEVVVGGQSMLADGSQVNVVGGAKEGGAR